MVALYIMSLIVGGGLLVLSLVAGGEVGEAEAFEGGGSEGSPGSALPLASMFFWTFFLAFFGLTGVLLSLLAGGAGTVLTVLLAVGMGVGAGLIASHVLRGLGRSEVDSSVRPTDLVGRLGRVVVPVGKEQPGKIRVELKGRTVELLAYGDETVPLACSQRVYVHDVLKDGSVRVVSAEAPHGAGPHIPVV